MAGTRTTITGVRVFDGVETLEGPRTVTVEDGVIASVESGPPAGAPAGTVVDGAGSTLLPGLIDTHAHVHTVEQVERATAWGVTTQLDMGAPHLEDTLSLRGREGLADLRTAGTPALAPGSGHLAQMGHGPGATVHGPDDAERFVAERVEAGSAHIKILLEDPHTPGAVPMPDATAAAVAEAAHRRGLIAIAHVTSVATVLQAVRAGVDVVTHTALTSAPGPELAAELAGRAVTLVPTLGMMRGVIERIGGLLPPGAPRMDYANALATVAAFRDAGRPVLAGTDANDNPAAPFQLPHGSSLHEELELLVGAGLDPAAALAAATGAAADVFGLADRGAVRPGLRADLLLVDGDPTTDITATRDVRGVWIAGRRTR
ncbi:amidohydrolase family protein [Nocardiopsis protaetiae]|uniref:amidohydrolase family protein n=1 Tax=Nocardiopsis protaetiae TaxID=3382270 RepID=UPI00387ADEF7